MNTVFNWCDNDITDEQGKGKNCSKLQLSPPCLFPPSCLKKKSFSSLFLVTFGFPLNLCCIINAEVLFFRSLASVLNAFNASY